MKNIRFIKKTVNRIENFACKKCSKLAVRTCGICLKLSTGTKNQPYVSSLQKNFQ